MDEETEVSRGRATPSARTIKAIELGVKRFGICGLVTRTKVVWSVVAGAGFAQPVKAESLQALEVALTELGLYPKETIQ